MPRRRRYCPAGLPVHIIQRGNNKQVCFTSDNDMAAYANWLKIAAAKCDLALGNHRFRAEVEKLTGQPQEHLKRGPKKAYA